MQQHLAEGSGFQDIDQILIAVDEVLTSQYIRFSPKDAWKPHINIYETTASFAICVDLAGMKPGAIQIDVQGRFLVLRGERPRPVPESPFDTIGVHLMEIDTGGFCRKIEIPSSIECGKITAKYRDGLLWITLPKRQ